MNKIGLMQRARDEGGAIAVIAAITLPIFIGFAALAIDLSHMYVVRNELQNAADSGALAGARVLYDDNGTSVNETANQTAFDAAVANRGQNMPVEVNWQGGNEGDVQRGHWSFATRTFTPNASLVPVELAGVPTEQLDANVDFINAVRVKTRREANPVTLFFARIFGKETAKLTAEAVAYRGFVGGLLPFEADLPIVICRESLKAPGASKDDPVTCNIGRMINSGQNITSNETGGWTDFNQENPCTGGTNATSVREKIDSAPPGNPLNLTFNSDIATNGGEIQSAFNTLIDKWSPYKAAATPWKVTLPVVTCPSNNIGTCEQLVGAVTISIVWITGAGEDPSYADAPYQMKTEHTSFDNTAVTDGVQRWSNFAAAFNLQNVDGSSAPYEKKSIYFLPYCEYQEPMGTAGGENFGILAKIPVLVR